MIRSFSLKSAFSALICACLICLMPRVAGAQWLEQPHFDPSFESGLTSSYLGPGSEINVRFINLLASPVKIYWLDYKGKRVLYANLATGQSYVQQTYLAHPWVITDQNDAGLYVIDPAYKADPYVWRATAYPDTTNVVLPQIDFPFWAAPSS